MQLEKKIFHMLKELRTDINSLVYNQIKTVLYNLPILKRYDPAGKFIISVCLQSFRNTGFSKCPNTLKIKLQRN
jgi:hypothetical protein